MKVNGQNWNEEFAPRYTPKELLEMGVFGGKYFNDIKDKFPKEWFENAKMVKPGSPSDINLNYFKVKSSLKLSDWKKKDWILTDDHGWMQWYFNYYLGRRIPDEDIIQIKRWKNVITRHMGQIKTTKDLTPKRGQALLHWSWDYKDKPTQDVFKNNLKRLEDK
ncbi:MAG: hypothetical protein ACRC92_20230 [Peptostreptococcaceae bacterium]